MNRSIHILIIKVNLHYPQQRNITKNALIVNVLSLLDPNDHRVKIVEIP